MSYSPRSKTSNSVVVDANITAGAVIPIDGLEGAKILFDRWAEAGRPLFAPAWWLSEVVSVIRQYVYLQKLSPARAHDAIDDILSLEVEAISLDFDLYHHALDWAEKMNHSKVYDALYLALAESLGAEFWTADRRLVESARLAGASWVHWIGNYS